MRDDTYNTHSELVVRLIKFGNAVISFVQYCKNPDKDSKWCFLRHDVGHIKYIRSYERKVEVIEKFTKYARVFITSRRIAGRTQEVSENSRTTEYV